jgi:hypothetical protein
MAVSKAMAKFLEKIEAIQYDGKNVRELEEELSANIVILESGVFVCTIAGYTDYAFARLDVTDWVIKRQNGSFAVVEDHVFKTIYKPEG